MAHRLRRFERHHRSVVDPRGEVHEAPGLSLAQDPLQDAGGCPGQLADRSDPQAPQRLGGDLPDPPQRVHGKWMEEGEDAFPGDHQQAVGLGLD